MENAYSVKHYALFQDTEFTILNETQDMYRVHTHDPAAAFQFGSAVQTPAGWELLLPKTACSLLQTQELKGGCTGVRENVHGVGEMTLVFEKCRVHDEIRYRIYQGANRLYEVQVEKLVHVWYEEDGTPYDLVEPEWERLGFGRHLAETLNAAKAIGEELLRCLR